MDRSCPIGTLSASLLIIAASVAACGGVSADADKVYQTLKSDDGDFQTCASYLELGEADSVDWIIKNYDLSFADIDRSDISTGVKRFFQYCNAGN